MDNTVKYSGSKLLSLLLAFLLLTFGFCTSASAAGRGKITDNDEFVANVKWKGDYDEMVEDRVIRFLIPYSKTFYFLDGATERGLSYDAVKGFEKLINERLKKRHLKVHAVIIPTDRSLLLPHLAEGLGDVAVGNLTITDERRKVVDFSDPLMKDVAEIVVTGKDVPDLKSSLELAGKEVYARESSSYYENLLKLNDVLKATGKKPVKIVAADEHLEDEDLLEMLDTGVIPMLVVDKHKAELWAKVLPNIKLHPAAAIASGGQIAWAFRKNSPQLQEIVNIYVKKNKKGTLHGNMAFNKYLKSTKYIDNPASKEDQERMQVLVDFFKVYAKKYDFEYLLLVAVAYQESRLDQNAKSHVGAIGVMQMLPTTAKDKNVNIPNIHEVEANIHAGAKYIRFIADRYFDDPGIDRLNRGLFSFAAYNAGPARVAKLRKEAKEMGLDPNLWFNNVEVVAAKRIGRETVQYVSNIFKYYVVYTILEKKGKL